MCSLNINEKRIIYKWVIYYEIRRNFIETNEVVRLCMLIIYQRVELLFLNKLSVPTYLQ